MTPEEICAQPMDETWKNYWDAVHTERLSFWDRKLRLRTVVNAFAKEQELPAEERQELTDALTFAYKSEHLDEIEAYMREEQT